MDNLMLRPLTPVLPGDFLWAIMMLFVLILSPLWPFIYNKHYATMLPERGYVPADDSEHAVLASK